VYNFKNELEFTKCYREQLHSPPSLRELKCLEVQFPACFGPIQKNDLIAGRYERPLVGFSIDEWGSTAFGYYHLPELIQAELLNPDYLLDQKSEIQEMLAFWERENTSTKLRDAYPDELQINLPSDDWMGESGIAFPLYRLTGSNLDYEKLLRLGISGLENEIQKKLSESAAASQTVFYKSLLGVLNILRQSIRHYQAEAEALNLQAVDTDLQSHYQTIIHSLENLLVSPPRNLHQAIQLFWIFSLLADNRNYGRMDVYLGDFLVNDLDSGHLTETQAQRLLNSLWQLMADRNTRVHGRVIIGGSGRSNPVNADRFALYAMEASRTVLEIEPQLSLRLHQHTDPALLEKALDVLAEGRTFPILYNDDVNIGAVQKAFGFSEHEAQQYVPFGCGEYILDHRSFGTPSGVINLLKALEVTLHNGRDPISGEPMGLSLGDPASFDSFNSLFEAYKLQVEDHVRMLADQEALAYKIAANEAGFLFSSLLYDDCIAQGRSIFNGGIRYLGGTLETYGNTNTADSLYAIKQVVYEQKYCTLPELVQAMDNNFQGHSQLLKALKAVPKYGIDDPRADEIFIRVHDHVCNTTRHQAERVGLDSYLVVIINNSANSLMGQWTGASADGRLAGTYMNNGNAPSSGNDREGITAMLNSIVKPDSAIHAGAVQNMKFSRDTFLRHRDKIQALLRAYFSGGGAQAMITVVDKGSLEEALVHPEENQHIFVRVGGFSARFVELDRQVQMDILHRTLY